MMKFKQWLCDHDYEVLEIADIQPSSTSFNMEGLNYRDAMNLAHKVFTRGKITHAKCRKCNHLLIKSSTI